ncbi:MAG: hypothetical protein ABIZ49_05975 [Opitutaceae bacterium]
MIPHATTRRFWENRATLLAWRINVAAWVARAAPAVFFVATVFAVTLYALRRVETPLGYAWLALGLVLAGAGVVCWWRARREFFRADEARVLLESHLRLDTRLTAAGLGLVRWPAEPAGLPSIVQWRLRATSGWIGAAVLLLSLAAFAPVSRDNSRGRAAGPPPALLQTEEMLSALQEMKVADPQAIEQLSERARELARRPAEEQYSHSALEAADALRNQVAVSAAGLGRGLESASNAMRSANGPDMKTAAGQLTAALSGLRSGALPINKDMLANLPASEADLKNLTPEQRSQLAQQLANAANGASGVAGAAGAGASVARPDPNSGFGRGQGRGRGFGPGDGFGSGGEGGGGGHAPLGLAKDASDAGDGDGQALKADALKNFSLGDKLGTTASAHDNDPNATVAPTSAGAVAAPASGGEAVWVNRLTPAERAALKNFFK